jgi:hypothetical protein
VRGSCEQVAEDRDSRLRVRAATTIQAFVRDLCANRIVRPCRDVAETCGIDSCIEDNSSAFRSSFEPARKGDHTAVLPGEGSAGHIMALKPIGDTAKDPVAGIEACARGNLYKLRKQAGDGGLRLVGGYVQPVQW